MKEIIHLILEYIGLATVISIILVGIRIAWENHIEPLKCAHKYKINAYLHGTNGIILFLKCENCGKEKQIEIFGNYEIITEEGGKNENNN